MVNEVQSLANQIIRDQRNEIRQMHVWQREWFGATGMMGNHGHPESGRGGMHNMHH